LAHEPQLRFVFEVRADVGPSEHIGNGAGDVLDFTPIIGGSVEGPRLRGTIVPGGGDWAVLRGSVYELDARYLIRAGDGALIDVVNRGYWRALTPEALARAEAGEELEEAEAYFRTSPVFRTDAPAHRWLAETVLVGLARDEDGQVCIRFYEVL